MVYIHYSSRSVFHIILHKFVRMSELPVRANIPVSPSFYDKLNNLMNKSPTAVISSICALFIVLILSLTLPLYFPTKTS